jgi:hypothetical protein
MGASSRTGFKKAFHVLLFFVSYVEEDKTILVLFLHNIAVKMLRFGFNLTRSSQQALRLQQRYCLCRPLSTLSKTNTSPTTEVRKNTAIDQFALWGYLDAQGLEGFAEQQQCVMKQFAHGRILYLSWPENAPLVGEVQFYGVQLLVNCWYNSMLLYFILFLVLAVG